MQRVPSRLCGLLLASLGAASLSAVPANLPDPSLPAFGGGADGPPNVLVVVADDFGVDQLAAYGLGANPAYTPTLDGLAASGVSFSRVWSNPLCSPTRATLLTGRYAFRTGLGFLTDDEALAWPLDDEWTLPELLEIGTGGAVEHAYFGKWHMGMQAAIGGIGTPNQLGWGHFEGMESNLYPEHQPDPPPVDFFDFLKITNGVAEQVGSQYATSATVDWALAWIGQQTGPWHAHVAFHAPHHPWHTPPPELHTVDLSQAGPPEDDPLPYYRAAVEALDTELGRLLAGLGDALADTVVVFVGDNGTPGPVVLAPFDPQHSKSTVFEGGVQVPLIVSGPGVQQGAWCHALVNVTDLFGTLLQLSGVVLTSLPCDPADLDTVPLTPYLALPGLPSARKHVYTELFHPNGPGPYASYRQAIREDRYKLIREQNGPKLFFDLAADPFETVNLLEGPLTPEEQRKFRQLDAALNALKPLP
ncbi:MAG TPA: sulfatase-like hydrolase/transferase [Planctomycetota bacterium]|nr:sulfatase-like hydrolase/transferase [Planctomycetota bacterium]